MTKSPISKQEARNTMPEPKTMTGLEVAEEYRKLLKGRLDRLDMMIRAFKDKLEAKVWDVRELNLKAGTFDCANTFSADLEELRWMATTDEIGD